MGAESPTQVFPLLIFLSGPVASGRAEAGRDLPGLVGGASGTEILVRMASK